MTFEEFWLAAAENDEYMKVLVQMENKHSEEAKEEIITQNEVITDVDELGEIVHYLENIGDMRGEE